MSSKSLDLQKKARHLIPGVSQLLSKRPEMFAPGVWPGYFQWARGCECCDLDGKIYTDMSINGIGATTLGFADPDVDAAVQGAIARGNMCSLNAPEEVELAEELCRLHPWAAGARYARSGGEAMSIAVRIARAFSGKDTVAFCGYHGWSDWYLAANLADEEALDGHLLPGLSPRGVPRGLAGTALPFHYNNFDELKALAEKHDLGAIVMEPIRDHQPGNDFLQKVRELATQRKIPLVFDEITAAFRLCVGGAHRVLNVEPDIAVLAKGISNGYPMAAILGNRQIMDHSQTTFISSTYWTDRIGPVAAIATIRKFEQHPIIEHLQASGKHVQQGWKDAAAATGLQLEVGGIYPLSHFHFVDDQAVTMMTLYTQLMLDRGFLASGRYYATWAHQEHHLDRYLAATKEVFAIIASHRDKQSLHEQLAGTPAHTGFKRLT